MPTLRIGRTEIPYVVRRSPTASERRITVTPGHVEVLALTADDDEAISRFVDRKRQWVFDTVRDMARIASSRHFVPRFATGSKIPFRGRNMSLTVRRTDTERLSITYRNAFLVDLPHWAERNSDALIASELKHWLKQRARRDARAIAADYGNRFGLTHRSVRVADFAYGWGSCGPEGNILINWNLIFAPRKVLEYVVVHELTHLRGRSHDSRFWAHLATMMPEFERPKSWLERHGSLLSSDFLDDRGGHFGGQFIAAEKEF